MKTGRIIIYIYTYTENYIYIAYRYVDIYLNIQIYYNVTEAFIDI